MKICSTQLCFIESGAILQSIHLKIIDTTALLNEIVLLYFTFFRVDERLIFISHDF